MLLRVTLRLVLLAALTTAPMHAALAAPLAAAPTFPETRGAAIGFGEPDAPAAVAPSPLGCAVTTVTFASATSTGIPDPGVITATLNVSGMGTYLWDLNLVTNLAHTNGSDLDVTLTSPAGTVSTITTDNGNSRQNVFNGTTWDDQALKEVSDWFFTADTVVTPFVPEEAMGAFIGQNPNGVWTLTVTDDTDNATTGASNGWSLQVTTLNLPYAPRIISNTYTAEPELDIPDDGQLVYTMTVADAGTTLGQLKVTTDLWHPNSTDLDVFLVSPTGITVTLTTDNGGSLNNMFAATEWYDRAGTFNPPGPASDAVYAEPYVESPLVPEGALSAYNGLDPNGVWKLIVRDDLPTNTGELEALELEVNTYDCLADMTVTGTTAASYAPLDSTLTYHVEIANEGVVNASNVVFSFELASGAAMNPAPSLEGWTCGVPVGQPNKFACSQASFLAGSARYFSITAQTPALPQQATALFTVTTTSTDSNLSNNTTVRSTYAGIFSANGNPWDVTDTNFGIDSGSLIDAGQDAFDGWGGLRLRVRDGSDVILTNVAELTGFDLEYTGNRRWDSSNFLTHSGISVSRFLFAPAFDNYVRYVDVFANTSGATRVVNLAWGGNLGSDSSTTVAATSNGDLNLTATDRWAVTIHNNGLNANGPAADAPVGYLLEAASANVYQGPKNWVTGPFSTAWAGNGSDALAHNFVFTLPANQTAALAYFVYRGLAEGKPGPQGCTTGCVTPGSGSQITLVTSALIDMADNPPLCDLPANLRAVIINWPDADTMCEQVYLPVSRR